MRHDFGDGFGPVPAHRHINSDGTTGGWVANSANVDSAVIIGAEAKVFGSANVMAHAKILESARVYGNALIESNSLIFGRAEIKGNARVTGNAKVSGTAMVYGSSIVKDFAAIYEDARIYGDSRVYGHAKVCGTATVFRNACIYGFAIIKGSSMMGGEVRVSGYSVFLSSSFDSGDYIDCNDSTARNSNSVATPIETVSLATGEENDMPATRRFGVEIELVGTTMPRVQAAFDDAGIDLVLQDYNHRTTTCWKVVPDSSLTPGGFEVVSPILAGEPGIATVRRVAAALNAAGASVDRTCGFHVHVDARDLRIDSIVQIAARYNRFENDINAFMPASRRESRYCHSINDLFMTHSVERILRGGTGYLSHIDRHHKVNLAAFARHGTVEFRQHSGTVNADKMEKWIRFCLGFVAASIVVPVVEAPVVAPPAVPPPVPEVPRRRNASNKIPRLYARFQALGMGQSIRVSDLAAEFEWTEATTMNAFARLRTEYGCRIRTRFGRARMSYDPQTAERAAAMRVPIRALTLPAIENDSLFRGIADGIESYFTARAAEFTAEGLIPPGTMNAEMSEMAA